MNDGVKSLRGEKKNDHRFQHTWMQKWAERKEFQIQDYTPWKIDMEHKNGGLEDDFPFQLGDVLGFMSIFGGCIRIYSNWFKFISLKNTLLKV